MQILIQVICVTAPILGGFAWLISYLSDRFNRMQQKLEQKVSQSSCRQRRQSGGCFGSYSKHQIEGDNTRRG